MSNQNQFFINASEIGKPYGHKPYFYSDSDACRDLLRSILGVHVGHKLYTYHAPVDLQPMPNELRDMLRDTYGLSVNGMDYGIRRFDALEFALRPHMQNVYSCHRFGSGYNAPGGNANYLANASWACYYQYNPNVPVTSLDCARLTHVHELPIPCPMASVNVCRGFVNGTPSVLFSRVYGDSSLPWVRLISHFVNQGFNVYSVGSIACNGHRRDASSSYTFYSIPTEIQVMTDCDNLIERYQDIDDARAVTIDGKVRIFERHSCSLIAVTSNVKQTRCIAENEFLGKARTKPTESQPLWGYLTSLYSKSFVMAQTLGLHDPDSTCDNCNSRCNEDDMTYIAGIGYVCQDCLDSDFTYSQYHGEYIADDDSVYSNVMEDSLYSDSAIEFAIAGYGNRPSSDYVASCSRYIQRYNVIELSEDCALTGCSYADIDVTETVRILSVSNYDNKCIIESNDDMVLTTWTVDRYEHVGTDNDGSKLLALCEDWEKHEYAIRAWLAFNDVEDDIPSVDVDELPMADVDSLPMLTA